MTADMNRQRQQFTGRRPGGPAPSRPATTTVAGAVAARHDIEQAEFDRQCLLFTQPTTTRPALLTAEEGQKLNADFGTGKGKLAALTHLVQVRESRWDEMRGAEPFHPINDLERQEASGWFIVHGSAVAAAPAGPRTAPPNPIRERAEAEKAAQIPHEPKPAAPAPAPMAGAAAHQDADLAILQAESKRPAAAPEPAKTAAPAPATRLEIQFVDPAGFDNVLVLAPDSTFDQVVGLIALGARVRAKLAEAGAKPPAPPVVAVAPSAGGEATSGPPKCKYHGAMKESRKPGVWFCPKKLADGTYCDQKVGDD